MEKYANRTTEKKQYKSIYLNPKKKNQLHNYPNPRRQSIHPTA